VFSFIFGHFHLFSCALQHTKSLQSIVFQVFLEIDAFRTPVDLDAKIGPKTGLQYVHFGVQRCSTPLRRRSKGLLGLTRAVLGALLEPLGALLEASSSQLGPLRHSKTSIFGCLLQMQTVQECSVLLLLMLICCPVRSETQNH
jgi:hypothetical protein